MCKQNFKSCDIATDTTYEICNTVCDGFVNSCGTNTAVCGKLLKSVKIIYYYFNIFL
jgi:hypothetical protein